MKQLVLKQTIKTKRGNTHKTITLPPSFSMNLKIENTGSLILEFRDDKGTIIHVVRIEAPKGFPEGFDRLPKDLKKELEAQTARFINYDLTYYLTHNKYWGEGEPGIENDKSGAFDLDMKSDEWNKAMCCYFIHFSGLPILIEKIFKTNTRVIIK